MLISDNDLQDVKDLWRKNLNLQAYRLAISLGPLEEWEGVEAKLQASHLVYDLGAPNKSFRWLTKAWREDPTFPETIFYRALDLQRRRGPFPALVFLQNFKDFNAEDRLLGWWY